MKTEYTSIAVTKDVRQDLMLFKIRTNARNLNDVLELAIKLLRIYT